MRFPKLSNKKSTPLLVDTQNTFSQFLKNTLPEPLKVWLVKIRKGLDQNLLRSYDFIDASLPLALNLRYQLKKALYNYSRNKKIRKINYSSIIINDNILESSEECRIQVVLPYWEQVDFESDIPQGNFFYEIFLSAREHFGNEKSNIIILSPECNWQEQIISNVVSFNPSHLILNLEFEPVEGKWWSLDLFLETLRQNGWQGNVIFIAYDSVWDLTKFRIDRLVKDDKNLTIVTIDRPFRRRSSPKVSYVGPCVLPFSNATVEFMRNMRKNIYARELPITFVGKRYDYRKKILDRLQRNSENLFYTNFSQFIPRYSDYLEIFSDSIATINFSKANKHKINQLKCRVIEATLMGCLVISDGASILDRFFPEIPILFFKNTIELSDILSEDLTKISSKVMTPRKIFELEDLAMNDFWRKIPSINI